MSKLSKKKYKRISMEEALLLWELGSPFQAKYRNRPDYWGYWHLGINSYPPSEAELACIYRVEVE